MIKRLFTTRLLMLAAIAGLCALAWLVWPATTPDAAEAKALVLATGATPAPIAPASGVPAAWPSAMPQRGDGIERVPLLPVDQSQSATASLAEAHLRGDPRTPPLVRVNDTTPAATDAERADPKAYAEYEARQSLRVLAQFSQAADQMLPQLRADIERGRQMGIAPEKIAKAEEKYRRIAEEQANILKQHPELANVAKAVSR